MRITYDKPTHYVYRPDGPFTVMGMRPGDTVEVQSEAHREKLDANRCFVPVWPEAADDDRGEDSHDGGE